MTSTRVLPPAAKGTRGVQSWLVRLRRNRTPSWALPGGLLLVAVAVFATAGRRPFVYDSLHYWTIAGSYVDSSGGFSITNFSDGLRGYSWPLVLYGVQRLATAVGVAPEAGALMLNSALLAVLCVLCLPALAARLLARPVNPLMTPVLCVFAVRVLWGGYASYPLTDVPAALLVICAGLLLWRPSVPSAVSAGLAVGLAANMRPAFLLACGVAVGIAAARTRLPRLANGSRAASAAAGAILVVLGCAVAFGPQIAVNVARHDVLALIPVGSGDIARLQFAEGLRYQKYATTLDAERGDPGLFYCDPAGARLLASVQQSDASLGSPADYVRFMAEHPFQALGVVGRRVANGVYNDASTPYLPGGTPAPTLGVLAVLVISVGAVLGFRSVRGRDSLLLLVLVLAPAAAAVTAIVETRFFLPVSLLGVALVAAAVSRPPTSWRSGLRATVAVALPAALLAVPVLVLAGTSNALEGDPRTETQPSTCARFERGA